MCVWGCWCPFLTLSSIKTTFPGRLLVKQQYQTPVGSQEHNNGGKACRNQSDMMFVCVFPELVCSVLHCLSARLSGACTHTLQMKSKIRHWSRWCLLGRHSPQFCPMEFYRHERIISHISLLYSHVPFTILWGRFFLRPC